MATEKPSAEAVAEFEEDLDSMATDVIEYFHYLGLPEGEQLSDLHVELTNALSGVLKTWL